MALKVFGVRNNASPPLIFVEYAPKHDASNILGFYMGKNTPERKDYIMENLVVPVED